MTDNLFEKLFGPTISQYSDDDAVHDGVLIPFAVRTRDTGHRITRHAWDELTTYQKAHGYTDYTETQFHDFFLAELLPLVPRAHHDWNYREILKTDYAFSTRPANEGVIWYVPNERGGITMMLPEDY